jgi:signal transduction histidine kinase
MKAPKQTPFWRMIIAPIPDNEEKRLEELHRYEILDTSYQEEFDDIVKLASQICEVPISLISLVESSRQWFKAKVGLDDTETSRDVSFCAHSLDAATTFLQVEDATKDERFFDNPLVKGKPNIRFYAGVPLVSSNGYKLGTLCVINSQPQQLTNKQTFALRVLAEQAMKLIELHIRNKQLDRQSKRLQQQAEMQNRIISIIAHDVRTPVSSLRNIIELSNSNILDEAETKELTLMADKQLENTINLLSDLVNWGRMQIDTSSIVFEKVHLRALVADKFKKFEVAASLKKNKLVNLIDEDLLLDTDKNALKFILRNLISNANKFTSKGTISIYAHKENDRVLITINDTGIGMNEEIKNSLFTSGVKYSSLGTNKEKGSGLGLMLTKDFVDVLAGTLHVQSEPNKGTTISIEFKA